MPLGRPPCGKPAQWCRPTTRCEPGRARTDGSGDDLGHEVGLDLREVAGLQVQPTLATTPRGRVGLGREQRRLLLGTDVLRLPATGAEPAAARRVDRARHVADEADALLRGDATG